jgi:hypothetical protein
MAASMIPAPGSELGPCESCEHRDCALSRSMAAAECAICHREIGYETRFYREGETSWHAVCIEELEASESEPEDTMPSCAECGSYTVTPTTEPDSDGFCEYRCDDCGEYFVGEARASGNER